MSLHWIFSRPTLPRRAIDEVRLLAAASERLARQPAADLDHERLLRLTESEGIDAATAVVYEWIRSRPANRAFASKVDAIRHRREFERFQGGTVVVVPASFYREFPSLGADGALLMEVGSALGLRSLRVDVPSRATVDEGAVSLLRTLRTTLSRPVVVASLSKGGADVRVALERDPEAFANVEAWIQVGGLLRGSPLADDLLGGTSLKRICGRAALGLIRAPSALVSGLRWHADPLGTDIRVPSRLRVFNVVGCPIRSHLLGNVAARWEFLARFGPNDGTSLVLDSICPGGVTYPIWGSDHYFRLPGTAELLYALYSYIRETAV